MVPSFGWENSGRLMPSGCIWLRMRCSVAMKTGFSASSIVEPSPAS